VLEALSVSVDIEKPGKHEVKLWELCMASGLSEEQVRRALSALDQEKLIGYEPPFRGRGIEKLVEKPPPFDEVPIDWTKHDQLRAAEEEKLEAMEKYIRTRGCRRGMILRYFGEKASYRCGICDNCKRSGKKRSPDRTAAAIDAAPTDRTELETAVLLCVRHLRFPVGKARVAQILTGSKRQELHNWKLDKNPYYGFTLLSQDEVRRAVDKLIQKGLLEIGGEPGRPVVELSEEGRSVVAAIDESGEVPAAPPAEKRRQDQRAEGEPQPNASRSATESKRTQKQLMSPAALLDQLLDKILELKGDEAKQLLSELNWFQPAALVDRLVAAYKLAKTSRAQQRAVWIAGELGDEHAVLFLLQCASSTDANVRRLTASALGKIVKRLGTRPAISTRDLEAIRAALQKLTRDDHPQVAQYAQKALREIRERRS